MTQRSPEAFMLMTYTSKDGAEREVLWNSRDGVTPFIIRSANSGHELAHTERRLDRFAPNHVPKVGDRIFVDLTPQRARWFAAQRIERMYPNPEHRAWLEDKYASREEATSAIAEEMLTEYSEPPPDILVVTAGYIEEYLEGRGRGADPDPNVKLKPDEGEPKPCAHGSMNCMLCDWVGGVPRWVLHAPRKRGASDAVVLHQRWEPDSLKTPSTALEQPHDRGYWNRKGERITAAEWARLKADADYVRVAYTKVEGECEVFTSWLGMASVPPVGTSPLIFSTIMRDAHGWVPDTEYRSITEEAARAAHEHVVFVTKELLKLLPDDEPEKNK